MALSAGEIVEYVFICLGTFIVICYLCFCWSNRRGSPVFAIASGWAMPVLIAIAPLEFIGRAIFAMVTRRLWIALLRFLNGLVCAVMGGFAAYTFAALHRSSPAAPIRGWKEWHASMLISTITGWVCCVSSIVSSLFMGRWRPWGFPYFFLLTDVVTPVVLIAAIALIPADMAIPVTACAASADGSPIFSFAGAALGFSPPHACQYLVTTYALELAVTVLCCLQVVLCIRTSYALLPIFPLRWLRHKLDRGRTARNRRDSVVSLSVLKPPAPSLPTGYKPSLLSAMENDAIVAAVANHLHYIDMVNLSSTSRRMRRAVFPGDGDSARFELLRVSSCTDGSKKECWSCARQICDGCRMERALPLSSIEWHMRCCAALCTKHAALRTYPSSIGHLSACPLLKAKEAEGKPFVCRICAAADARDVVRTRERRDVRSMQRLLRVNEPRCTVCEKHLERAMWWCCPVCGVECDWEGHSPGK